MGLSHISREEENGEEENGPSLYGETLEAFGAGSDKLSYFL